MIRSKSINSIVLTPDILKSCGFKKEGYVNGIFGKDHLRLLQQESGYFIVDKALNKLNRKPIICVDDLKIIHEFFLGTSLSVDLSLY